MSESILGKAPSYRSIYKRKRTLHDDVFQRELNKFKSNLKSL